MKRREMGKWLGLSAVATAAGKVLTNSANASGNSSRSGISTELDGSDEDLSSFAGMKPKVILITGSASGFGKSAALQLIEMGHFVYGADIEEAKNQYLTELGATALMMDVRSDTSVNQAVEQVIQAEGRIDVLLNNAGYGTLGSIEEVPMEEIINQFDVNLFGYARVQKAVLPHMRSQRSGRIVLTSSVVGEISAGYIGWYCASKHAVEGMVDAMRAELAEFNIAVVKVQPGAAQTNFAKVAFSTLDRFQASSDYLDLQEKFTKVAKFMFKRASKSEAISRVIVKAALSERPRPLYQAGLDSKAMSLLNDLVPLRLYDRLYKGIIDIGGRF